MDPKSGLAWADVPPNTPAPSTTLKSMRVDRGRSYQEAPNNHVVLWDLDLATWLLMKGLGVAEIWREGSEFRIVFYDPEHKVQGLHVEFLNSESAKFATTLKQLKKAAHSIGPRPPSGPVRR